MQVILTYWYHNYKGKISNSSQYNICQQMLPSHYVPYVCNLLHWFFYCYVTPRPTPQLLYFSVLNLPVLSFYVTSHSNPLYTIRPIFYWPITYNFVPTFSVPCHIVPPCCNTLCSFPSSSYSSPPITLHIVLSYCDIFCLFPSQYYSLPYFTFRSILSHWNLVRSFLSWYY